VADGGAALLVACWCHRPKKISRIDGEADFLAGSQAEEETEGRLANRQSFDPAAGSYAPAKRRQEVTMSTAKRNALPAVLVLALAGSLTGPLSSASAARRATRKPSTAAHVPYRIVKMEDMTFAGRRRVSLRVVIQNRKATPQQVHAALLDAAKGQNAVAVMAFGYWPGDNTNSFYTAGRLEWGPGGQGWANDDRVPLGGKFDGP
jgi:hypothetical protein